MRFLTGLVFGCLLTIGAAWFHDSGIDASSPAAESRRMVNWEVLDRNVQQLTSNIRTEWDRLTRG